MNIVASNSNIGGGMQKLYEVKVTGYYHIGSQQGRVPTQVRAGRPDSGGGVGAAGPSSMKM
jgi:hypothetical protein